MKVNEILPDTVAMENVKEIEAEIRLNEKGEGSATASVTGYLDFIQVKKQFDSIGEPIVTVTSDKLVEPILRTTVKKSGIYPVRTIGTDLKGEPLNILNNQHMKIPLKDTLNINVSNGLPNSRIDVLIRYG